MALKSGTKNPTFAVLRAFAKTIAELSDSDLAAIGSGDARLSITRSSDDSRQTEMMWKKARPNEISYTRLREELQSAESTVVGFEKLRAARMKRSDLERFARSLDLSVLKEDSVGRLEEKIVEALIGSRLNSRAVRGR